MTKKGVPCTMPAMRGQEVCFAHSQDPETVKRRAAALSLGGRHGGTGRRSSRAGAGRMPTGGSGLSLRQLTAAEFWRVLRIVRLELRRRVAAGEITVEETGPIE